MTNRGKHFGIYANKKNQPSFNNEKFELSERQKKVLSFLRNNSRNVAFQTCTIWNR